MRTALVGCGRISVIHAEALRDVPGASLVAVCDRDLGAARARAATLPGAAAYDDLAAMLREARPEVVHVLTPPASHLEIVRAVAAHGAHLYVEKPVAVTEASAVAQVQAARAAGVALCPGHNRLFEPLFQEACARVEAGEIGRVVSVRAEQGYSPEGAARGASVPWSYTYDWGIFENLVAHPLYLATRFLRSPGEPLVHAFNVGRVPDAAVEEFRILLPSASAAGEVVLSLNAAPERNAVEICGTAGRIVANLVDLHLVIHPSGGLPATVRRLTRGLSASWQLSRGTARTVAGLATGRLRRYMGLRRLIAAFHAALEHGQPPPVAPEEAILNARLIEAVREAARPAAKRRVVPVPGLPRAEVLVTGGTGFLGGRLLERLSAQGTEARALTRLPSRARPLPGVAWVQGDLLRPEELRDALRGVRTVYHCAAQVGAPGSLEDFRRVNVEGTLALARAAAEAGVEVLVHVSSIGVYAPPNGHGPDIDEGHPLDPRAGERGAYTRTKLDAEQALRAFARREPRPRIVILRVGSLYGPGGPVPLGRLRLPSPERRPLLAGGRSVPLPLAYVDNAVDAMLAAARAPVPTGRVYDVVDGAAIDQGTVARLVESASGGRIRARFLPYGLVWTLMLGVDLASLVRTGRAGTARYRLSRTLADMRYPSRAARDELRWEPRVPLEEGVGRTVAAALETPYPH